MLAVPQLMSVIIAQTVVALAHQTPADSIALRRRAEHVEFQFMMDWRYSWMVEMNLVRADAATKKRSPPPYYDPRFDIRRPHGSAACDVRSNVRYDIDSREMMAHLVRGIERIKMSFCPQWISPNWWEPPDERKSIDASLNPDGFSPVAADTARLMRAPVIALLDSAARKLPGDGWIAGQRVRLRLDQADVGAARRAATECRARAWWCTALLAYVDFVAGDVSRASATFDRARAAMPDSIRCDWDDASMFFARSGGLAYNGLSCAQRDSLNSRIWWLADPLYLENGNERRTEHYARHVLIALHSALEADERYDWRELYQGPALTELILRYGWPTQIPTRETRPRRWHWGDSDGIFLGDTSYPFEDWCGGMTDIPSLSNALCPYVEGPLYWGPQFHTVPLWHTVLDPFHATDDGWDLAPPRDGGPYWDPSWWPTEFYRRDNGSLVPLSVQTAFFRRQNTAVLATAMSWDTIAYLAHSPPRMIAGVIATTGPTVFSVARDTMSARALRPIVSAIASGPALLSVEMVPNGMSGGSARTRFGIDAPQPLRAVRAGVLQVPPVRPVDAASSNEKREAPTLVRNP